ncbi:MAG: hypothetical protein Q9219_002673 [cf. Caloplaca sp. 3 TL-2023]
MSGNLLSYVGWTFLPNLVTGWVQSLYYGITIRAGDPKPQPGSPKYLKHRQRIHIAVIVIYLLYTIYEADYWVRVNGDFYQDLDLPVNVDEKKIKSRFRRLAAIYHPDKAISPEDHANAEAYFVRLKTAQDTLTDATKRFAYDRFGPDMLKWQQVSSIRDYILVGLQSTGPFLAHKTTLTFFIALGQLSPFFAPPNLPGSSSASAFDEQQLQRLEQLAQSTDIETARLLALEMAPLVGDEAGQNDMRSRVREWIVQNTIRADPEVRDAMGKAMQKRRIGAPAGARQTVTA